MILNLGCGKHIMKGVVNIDIIKPADQLLDLSVMPWIWLNESVDGIFAAHIMEHFPDQEKFLSECYRILKPGGFLKLNLPHSSSISSVGCIGHYRTYSYSSVNDYLSREGFYLCKKKRFETIYQHLNWWYERIDDQKELKKWQVPIIKSMDYVLTRLANLSPKLCENLWAYWVGGMREVSWIGYKI